MSVLLKIKDEDNKLIEKLQRLLDKKSKVDVLRDALTLLEEKIEKESRVKKWERASKLAASSSAEVNKDFTEDYEFPDED